MQEPLIDPTSHAFLSAMRMPGGRVALEILRELVANLVRDAMESDDPHKSFGKLQRAKGAQLALDALENRKLQIEQSLTEQPFE